MSYYPPRARTFADVDCEGRETSAQIRDLWRKKKALRDEKRNIAAKAVEFFGSEYLWRRFRKDYPNFGYVTYEDGSVQFFTGLGGEKHWNGMVVWMQSGCEILCFQPAILFGQDLSLENPRKAKSVLITPDTFSYAFVLPPGERVDPDFGCMDPYKSGEWEVHVFYEWKRDVLKKLPEVGEEFLGFAETTLRKVNPGLAPIHT